jgi:hypothetical protein
MKLHRELTRRLSRRALPLLVAVVPGLTACSSLLDVTNPASVQAADLDNPLLAQTMVNSAVGRFECAYVNHLVGISMIGHEIINTSGWAAINSWGMRSATLKDVTGAPGCPDDRTSNAMGSYTPLQQARYLAEDGARRITAFADADVPNKTRMLATLEAYAGYATLLLGEGFCEMAFDEGPLMTRQQSFQRAEARFTAAIAQAQGAANTNLRLLATLGRARARLDLKNMAGAAADADQIPAGFVFNAEYSTVTGMRENRFYNMINVNKFIGVEPAKYGNVMLGTVQDKRVPVVDTKTFGQSGGDAWWRQDKYTSASAPIVLASWAEAQLIIAEARPADAVAAINRLRTAQGLPAYVPSSDVLADVLEERRRQLFLEGHRLNDMLRHNLPFPTGLNHRRETWGPVTCLPLPDQEKRNNPNIGA